MVSSYRKFPCNVENCFVAEQGFVKQLAILWLEHVARGGDWDGETAFRSEESMRFSFVAVC
jgi:hypothetical protein